LSFLERSNDFVLGNLPVIIGAGDQCNFKFIQIGSRQNVSRMTDNDANISLQHCRLRIALFGPKMANSLVSALAQVHPRHGGRFVVWDAKLTLEKRLPIPLDLDVNQSLTATSCQAGQNRNADELEDIPSFHESSSFLMQIGDLIRLVGYAERISVPSYSIGGTWIRSWINFIPQAEK
jgi:hypothetical protein